MVWLCNCLAALLAHSLTELSAAKVWGKVPMPWDFLEPYFVSISYLYSCFTFFFPAPNDATAWPETLPLLCSQTEPSVYKRVGI